MLKLFIRRFRSAAVPLSRTVSSRIIIPPASHFGNIGNLAIKIPRHEYKQLPDDSNYIEKFYDELEIFSRDVLGKRLNKTYTDFEDEPEELQFQIEQYIELEIIPRHSDYESSGKSGDRPARFVQCRTLRDKIVIERFLDFARSVRLTLMLNGGHTFIFDILLQAKKTFDAMQNARRTE
ncbi:hypothetical protein HG536_0C03240 [Torulaspora globosa]|uniref:Uncharacterized protein n=1 Tax=Torulaspora globosa TaxID=48254 RepID=A0A7G3ZF69_9SACH|nr:uncharacterized protein HG536_0C03240 [Torulaspora globosa]QLL32155.1 hypothetical protein HG536_0C03240 [Torulaspora globosa]